MDKITKIGALLLLVFATFACDDPWEKHMSNGSKGNATKNLMEIISSTPELSLFAALIEQAGLESQYDNPGAYTVWAPTNDALGSLNADLDNDSVKLKSFINNHISAMLYPQDPKQEVVRCKMINGKHVVVNMSEPSINDRTITGEFNHLATNGILHLVDQSIDLLPNIWEFIENTDLDLKQIEFLNSLSDSIFSDEIATLIGYDPITSQPLYDTLSGMMWYNPYVSDHVDLKNEDSLYTFLLLEDDVYDLHYNRFEPYYNLKATDDRDPITFSNYMVCYDLTGQGIQTLANTNGFITAVTGIEVPFTGGGLVETIKTSNGIIHRLSACDLSLKNKFPPIVVEGEDIDKVVYTGGGKTGYTRVNPKASGGFDFVLDDHDANPGRIVYNMGMIAATKYEFYWVAVDDFDGTYYGYVEDSVIKQKIEKVIYIPDAPLENMFPVHHSISDSLIHVVDKSYEDSSERFVGSATFAYYEDLWIHLIGSAKNTSLTLDYIKIKPVFDE